MAEKVIQSSFVGFNYTRVFPNSYVIVFSQQFREIVKLFEIRQLNKLNKVEQN